jgi:hypothetical protein
MFRGDISASCWLWQLFIQFELKPQKMTHRVVIQATDGNIALVRFYHSLCLIKQCAGENTATDSCHLNAILQRVAIRDPWRFR